MSALTDPVSCRVVHQRRVVSDGYLREDGLYEIDARITDIKHHDYLLASGRRYAGQPIHDMQLRLSFDGKFFIAHVAACSNATPCVGCEVIAPAYAQLAGKNLLRGFRQAVKELFGGVQGCTHITELLLAMPTVAVQTYASFVDETVPMEGRKPMQLDGCHALNTQGSEIVVKYYPQWAKGDGCNRA